ncbi:MAG: LacI family DNA-binding transcriptional regulator [Candidatus Methylacidiphilales bacterium]|nr:LacI family DNA-binding transcriptional regulator [Candidatus Methylacidiphilales bacterium]
MSAPRVTLKDIASKLGVSHATVSLALKNHPRISKERRDEVHALAEKMGYQPDPMLSSLVAYRHSKRSIPIHSAIAWINHWDKPDALRQLHEFDLYWQGASKAVERFGYRLEEFVWKKEMTARRMETILNTRQIRGVLIPPHQYQPDWGDFHWQDFSVIRFGLSIKNIASHIVTSDQMQGVSLAAKTIHDYGYERIGFAVSNQFDKHLGGNHLAGYQAAQRIVPFQHVIPPLLLPINPYQPKQAAAMLEKWITKYKPDAILTTDPLVPAMLHDLGMRIPEDVAVASTSLSDILSIDAGLDQNSEEIGRVAVETVISLINANDSSRPFIPRRILVASTWRDGKCLPRKNPTPEAPGDETLVASEA